MDTDMQTQTQIQVDNDNDPNANPPPNPPPNVLINTWDDDTELYVFQWRRHGHPFDSSPCPGTRELLVRPGHQSASSGDVGHRRQHWPGRADDDVGLEFGVGVGVGVGVGRGRVDGSDGSGGDTYMSSHVVIILSGILSIVVAVLTSLHNTLQFDVKGHQHLLASRNYQKLTLSIDVMLCQPRTRREKASVFIDRLIWSFNNQTTTAPVLSSSRDDHSSLPSPIVEL